MQADLGRQETVDHYSSLGLRQPEQGRDQGAFTGSGPPNNANLQRRHEGCFYFSEIKQNRIVAVIHLNACLCHRGNNSYSAATWTEWRTVA